MAFSSSLVLLLQLLALLSIFTSTTFSLNSTTNTSTDDFSTDDASTESISSALTISQLLTAHNAARRAIPVPPLTWDTKLATYARVYARQRRSDCQLVHSPGYAYGENIFWGKGKRWSGTDVVAAWVAEKQWYRYDTNSCVGPDCSHYTQIVWRTTEKVGCAKIICKTGDTFVACEYYPPGNYVGARPYVIPKP